MLNLNLSHLSIADMHEIGECLCALVMKSGPDEDTLRKRLDILDALRCMNAELCKRAGVEVAEMNAAAGSDNIIAFRGRQ